MCNKKYLNGCVEVLYYLYQTKQSIKDFHICGGFRKIVTSEGENITVLGNKIVRYNNLISKDLQKAMRERLTIEH